MRHVSTLFELIGLAIAAVGVWLFDWRAGVIMFGVTLVFVGYALGRPDAPGEVGG